MMAMLPRNPEKNGPPQRSQSRPSCPQCGRGMTVRQAAPLMFTTDIDEVVYGCADCGAQAKRTVKRS